jgi:hypothetical protein
VFASVVAEQDHAIVTHRHKAPGVHGGNRGQGRVGVRNRAAPPAPGSIGDEDPSPLADGDPTRAHRQRIEHHKMLDPNPGIRHRRIRPLGEGKRNGRHHEQWEENADDPVQEKGPRPAPSLVACMQEVAQPGSTRSIGFTPCPSGSINACRPRAGLQV